MIELMTSLHTNMGRVAEMFRSMDKDKSGRLERSEWLKGLSQYFSNQFDDDALLALFDSIDTDASGSLCAPPAAHSPPPPSPLPPAAPAVPASRHILSLQLRSRSCHGARSLGGAGREARQ